MRSEAELNLAIEKYADMVRRVTFMYLKNTADTEDIFQNVFLKYYLYEGDFANEENEKAWLIRVSINAAKDFLKSFSRRVSSLDELIEQGLQPESEQELETEDHAMLKAVLQLPKKYKEVIYLFYYEDYSAVEIAEIMEKPVNTIYSLLSRAREKLKNSLGDYTYG